MKWFLLITTLLTLSIESYSNDFYEFEEHYELEFTNDEKSYKEEFIEDLWVALKGKTSNDTIIALIGQSAVESGWGRSMLSSKDNNYFGIKYTYRASNGRCKYSTLEYIDGYPVVIDQYFSSYKTIEDCVDDRLRIMRTVKGRYATNPNYWSIVRNANRIIRSLVKVVKKKRAVLKNMEFNNNIELNKDRDKSIDNGSYLLTKTSRKFRYILNKRKSKFKYNSFSEYVRDSFNEKNKEDDLIYSIV